MYAANDLLPVIRVQSHGTQERSKRIVSSTDAICDDGLFASQIAVMPLTGSVHRPLTNRSWCPTYHVEDGILGWAKP